MIHNNHYELLKKVLTSPTLGPKEIVRLFSIADKSEDLNLLETYLMIAKHREVKLSELIPMVNLLLQKAKRFSVRKDFIDVCGTGGDKSSTFNISTTVAFVMAAGGVPVVKHGNRSITSKCGSSDLIEALGINLKKASQRANKTFNNYGFAYLHAPFYHPFFGKVAPLRKKIGEPTLFNFLGPLLHPAKPRFQLAGIADEKAFYLYPQLLAKLGRKSAIVLRGEGGIDEATPFGKTEFYRLEKGSIKKGSIRARDFGFKSKKLSDLVVKSRKENIKIFNDILTGKDKGPHLEAVLINAGLGFMLLKKAKNLKEGIKFSHEIIESKKALKIIAGLRRELK